MHIVIVSAHKIPAILYGGIERVVWDLGKALHDMGHKVTFMVLPGSQCNFADVRYIDDQKDINSQIPQSADFVHLFHPSKEKIDKPHLFGLATNPPNLDFCKSKNIVFVSKNHAARYNNACFVHNGIDWEQYLKPELDQKRNYFHFLAKAAWRVKNVKGAIDISRKAGAKLVVMGGGRLNIKMGFRFTPYPSVRFKGMVNNTVKSKIMNQSRGLLFPVRWPEPFGVALTESLYFGCPVFGTPYGSLPELIIPEVGFLSASESELSNALASADSFSRKACHEYAQDLFNAKVMAKKYFVLYEKVLRGEELNKNFPKLVEKQHEKFLPFTK